MKKFLKIETGASGATGEGAYYAVDRFESIAPDDSNDALDIEGFGGAKGVDLSLQTEANKEDEAAEVLLDEVAYGKELVIDALKFSDFVRGPELGAITLTNTAIAASADLQFTPASATAGVQFKAKIVNDDEATEFIEKSGTFTSATAPIIVFDNTPAVLAASDECTVTIEMFYPNRPDLVVKTVTHDVTLT